MNESTCESQNMQKKQGNWGFCTGVATAGVLAIGCFFAGRASQIQDSPWFPPIKLDATATDSGDEFAIATGMISDEVEGLFVLDYATGLLQCHVMYTRNRPIFGAVFQANVKELMAGDVAKGASKYLMVTGKADFPGSAQRSGGAVVYVLDTVSGAFVAYGVPYDRTAVNSGRAQTGALVPLANGLARGVMDRDRAR